MRFEKKKKKRYYTRAHYNIRKLHSNNNMQRASYDDNVQTWKLVLDRYGSMISRARYAVNRRRKKKNYFVRSIIRQKTVKFYIRVRFLFRFLIARLLNDN